MHGHTSIFATSVATYDASITGHVRQRKTRAWIELSPSFLRKMVLEKLYDISNIVLLALRYSQLERASGTCMCYVHTFQWRVVRELRENVLQRASGMCMCYVYTFQQHVVRKLRENVLQM